MSKRVQDPPSETIRAIVAKVELEYAVAYVEHDHGSLKKSDSVTFSLIPKKGITPAWTEMMPPQHGQVVDLVNVTLHQRGWRAESACPVTPNSNQARSR